LEAELEALRGALFEPRHAPIFTLTPLTGAAAPAAVEAVVLGGSLAVLVTTLGTPWEIDTREAILFLEDVNEPPYRIDRMVSHLRAAGKLEQLRGLVLGYFRDCDGEPAGLLEEVLLDLFGGAPFPVARGLPAGHGAPNLALPLGQRARLSVSLADNGVGGDGGAGVDDGVVARLAFI
jgi:muramoyltetrapeptide carboxypeptidase LdcA involved in peptidoglycan recycling